MEITARMRVGNGQEAGVEDWKYGQEMQETELWFLESCGTVWGVGLARKKCVLRSWV